jgi:hypothetical protein
LRRKATPVEIALSHPQQRRPFATLPAPPEAIRTLPGGRLLVTTALHTLVVARPGRVTGLRPGVGVASN